MISVLLLTVKTEKILKVNKTSYIVKLLLMKTWYLYWSLTLKWCDMGDIISVNDL